MVEPTAAGLPGGGTDLRTPTHTGVAPFIRLASVRRSLRPVNVCGNAVTGVYAALDGSNDLHLDAGPRRFLATHDAAILAPCNARTGGRKARAIRT